MSNSSIGVMVELDYCVGCYACQSACQNYNDLPVKETYLRCILAKPEKTRGEMHCFMSPVPYDFTACERCIERNGGEAPCAKICIGKALHIGPVEDVIEQARQTESRVALYF